MLSATAQVIIWAREVSLSGKDSKTLRLSAFRDNGLRARAKEKHDLQEKIKTVKDGLGSAKKKKKRPQTNFGMDKLVLAVLALLDQRHARSTH